MFLDNLISNWKKKCSYHYICILFSAEGISVQYNWIAVDNLLGKSAYRRWSKSKLIVSILQNLFLSILGGILIFKFHFFSVNNRYILIYMIYCCCNYYYCWKILITSKRLNSFTQEYKVCYNFEIFFYFRNKFFIFIFIFNSLI